MKYSDTLSADSYWMSDPSLAVASQGACALLPRNSAQCDNDLGNGLSVAQRALTANYAYNVTRLEALEAIVGVSKPILVDVETGCPFTSTPAQCILADRISLCGMARSHRWRPRHHLVPAQFQRPLH